MKHKVSESEKNLIENRGSPFENQKDSVERLGLLFSKSSK